MIIYILANFLKFYLADIAQLGERKTEDLKVTGSIPVVSNFLFLIAYLLFNQK